MGKIKEFEINNDYNSGCIIGEMASGQCFKTFTLALVNAFMGKKGGGYGEQMMVQLILIRMEK